MWRPGIEHKIVDCFSRYPVDDPDVDDEQADVEATAHKHAMLFEAKRDHTSEDRILALLEDPHLTHLKTEANWDPQYQQLLTAIQHGFPSDKRRLDRTLGPYFAIRHDLWTADGIVMYGSRVVVPARLRQEVLLRELHSSHLGQDHTLCQARQVVYWPTITNGIRNVVRSCAAFTERLPSHTSAPLLVKPQPSRSFESSASDLFQMAGHHFLVYTDRFSGWPTSVTVAAQPRRPRSSAC